MRKYPGTRLRSGRKRWKKIGEQSGLNCSEGRRDCGLSLTTEPGLRLMKEAPNHSPLFNTTPNLTPHQTQMVKIFFNPQFQPNKCWKPNYMACVRESLPPISPIITEKNLKKYKGKTLLFIDLFIQCLYIWSKNVILWTINIGPYHVGS